MVYTISSPEAPVILVHDFIEFLNCYADQRAKYGDAVRWFALTNQEGEHPLPISANFDID